MNLFLLILGGAAGVTGIAWARHLQRLKRHHGLSRAEFLVHFQSMAVPPEMAGGIYDHFQKLGVWKDFMPSPSDTLQSTYKTVDEDVEDNLTEVVQQLGYQMPHSGILAEWAPPIQTVEDVVRFVDWVRTKQHPVVIGE